MNYTLTISNIEYLKKEISKSGLTFSHLLDDLIDHVCCDVEYEMSHGLPFEKAYEMVNQKIGLNGLERIQHETLYLIDKKYRTMKKTMKISGLIAPILLAISALFKIEHWPGAGPMLVLGFFLLACFFLPSAIYVSYKEVSNKTKKWTHLVGFLGTFFLSVGFLFKIMHWPGAAPSMIIGVTLVCLVFLPMVIVSRLQSKELQIPRYVLALALIGLSIFILAMLFKIMHWPGAAILMLSGGIILIFIAFPIYVFKTYNKKDEVENSFIYLVLVLVWFIVPVSLLSLNVSGNYLTTSYETNSSLISNIKYIESENTALKQKLLSNSKVSCLDSLANKMFISIQDIKLQMVSCIGKPENSDSYTDNSGNLIYNNLPVGNGVGLLNFIMFKKSNAGNELAIQLQKLQNECLTISEKREYQEVVKSMLDFKIAPSEFNDDVLMQSLNLLSIMQLNILLTEQISLKEIALTANSEKLSLKQ